MALSRVRFAEMVREVRPALLRDAVRWRRCGRDEAEDLVCEAVERALDLLPRCAETMEAAGAREWLRSILYREVQRDRRASDAKPVMMALDEANGLPAGDSATRQQGFEETLRGLPRTHRAVVREWLTGALLTEIARRCRLHRNTVKLRLREAFSMLRDRFTDRQALEDSFAVVDLEANVTVYRKPRASRPPWHEQHPPERPFRRRPRRGPE